MYKLFLNIIKKPTPINNVMKHMTLIFTEIGISFFSTNDFKFFSYILLFINQLCNLVEPLAKQISANSKNGVVGNIGKNIPNVPKNNPINPKIM